MEVAKRKGRDDCIEGFVGERHVGAVFILKRDDVAESHIGYFLSAHIHHALAYVASDDESGTELLVCEDGKITCACRYVEDAVGACPVVEQILYGGISPVTVNAEAQCVVEHIVRMSNVVKHAFDLFSFCAVVSVWFYLLLLVHVEYVMTMKAGPIPVINALMLGALMGCMTLPSDVDINISSDVDINISSDVV